ncbi:SusC/RagA family TonB-linked outer membrane protein [Petrimonas sp.]|uniref:SusC/RagA family TonB-linked outer membrane protein n=1 Tax=Petrimonas sp. TaxID=2023866 RepID=UPI003F512217
MYKILKSKKSLTLFITLLCWTQLMVAQQITVKSTLVDEQDEPVIGATVLEKGTSNGTVTDYDGNFSLNVSETGVIQISYVGYTPIELNAREVPARIVLREDATALAELVVTGYSTQRKADLTGAVSVVKMDEIANMNTGNAIKSLQGRVPGVFIQTSGAPDGGATVRIRGIGTLGNNDPLYIIDGVPSKRSLNELSASDIESIQVLKDASSASIYGSRAANGVVIITTKKGKNNEMRIDFRTSVTAQSYYESLDLLNAEQRGIVQWRAAMNDGVNPNFGVYNFRWRGDAASGYTLDEVIMPEYLDQQQTMRPADTDWMKEVGRTGWTQNYNLTLSGGSEKGRALFSVDYFDNAGTVKGTYYNRLNVRINSDYSLLNDRLKIGENLSISKIRRSMINSWDILNMTHEIQPIIPVHTIDGGWGGPVAGMSDRQNPVRIIEDNKQNHNDLIRLFGDVNLSLKILENLNFRSTLGVDYTGFWQRNMQLKYVSGFMSENTNRVDVSANYAGNWILSNTLNYNYEKGRNVFDVMAGQEMIKYAYQGVTAGRDVFASEDPDYMYLNAGESNRRNGGDATAYSLMSYFGKVNYNYDNRYLASVTLRYDGSSRFGANNRYGTFPAFSLGWRLSQEQFFAKAFPFVSDLKLRYGWGQTGNQEIGDFASLGIYEALYGTDPTWNPDGGTAYDINGAGAGNLPSGYRRMQMANPNLKWETTTQSNIGVDFGFLNQKISGSFDYFFKSTKDILINPPFIATIGEGGSRWVNGATLENRGMEFVLSYTDKIGDVGVSVTGNLSNYKNKVVKLPEDVINSYPGNGNDQTILGRPLNSMFGYVADGIFQTQAEVDAHVAQTGKGIGRIRYKNINGDQTIDDRDRTWIGVGDPDLIYGLNIALDWKRFDLSMFWKGLVGNHVNNEVKRYTDFISFFGGHNYGARTLDAWTPQNTSSTIPMLSLNDNNFESRFSTYFIENASFLKLANLELGYNIPEKTLNPLHISNARIYVSGQNLWTIKKWWGTDAYTGIDPETPNLAYPFPTSVTFGLNISF